MDLYNLKAFLTVAEHTSVSLAAEKLFITQPAVTKRIQNLESQLDLKLFDRIGRQLLLTEAGQCLLPRARQIIGLVDDSIQALQDLASSVGGTLRLVTSHHIGIHRLPAMLSHYKRSYPQVKLSLRFLDSREAYDAVLDGEAELGIITQEEPASDRVLASDVWEDSLHFVAAREHALARKDSLDLRELSAWPAILPDARFFTGRVVRELFQERGIELKVDQDLSTNYLETLKALVTIGDSWSVLPASMLDERTLATLPVEGVSLSRRLVAIRHAQRSLSKAGQAFLEVLKLHGDQGISG